MSFPVDDVTLAALEHAMGGAYTVDEDGTHHLVGAEYSVSQFLDWMSNVNPEDWEFTGFVGAVECYTSNKPIYSERDVMRALIAEVRRLRSELE